MIVCSWCKTERDDSVMNGYYCNPCRAEMAVERRKRYKANKITSKIGHNRKYVYDHPKQYALFNQARLRAHRKDLPFNIKPADIIIPTRCPILGIPLRTTSNGASGPTDDSPSLDRIIPKLGYVVGNINVISHRANTLKSSATLEESEKITNWLRSNT